MGMRNLKPNLSTQFNILKKLCSKALSFYKQKAKMVAWQTSWWGFHPAQKPSSSVYFCMILRSSRQLHSGPWSYQSSENIRSEIMLYVQNFNCAFVSVIGEVKFVQKLREANLEEEKECQMPLMNMTTVKEEAKQDQCTRYARITSISSSICVRFFKSFFGKTSGILKLLSRGRLEL